MKYRNMGHCDCCGKECEKSHCVKGLFLCPSCGLFLARNYYLIFENKDLSFVAEPYYSDCSDSTNKIHYVFTSDLKAYISERKEVFNTIEQLNQMSNISPIDYSINASY